MDSTSAAALLVIEDDDNARAGLSSILSAGGYRVTAVADGREGLDRFHQSRPTLILLDMLVPGFDGWQFLAQRQLDPELAATPVVIMTGITIASEEWAQSLGAAALLRKPMDPDTVLDQVRRHAEPSGSPPASTSR